MNSLSDNDLATLLLCSDLACPSNLRPYSDSTYSKFAYALFKSGYQPSDLFMMPSSKILEITQNHKELFTRVKNIDFDSKIPLLLKRHTQLCIEFMELEKRGIRLITRADKKRYPQKISKKFKNSGLAIPSVIYYSGELSLLEARNSVAVVGSRDLTQDKSAQNFTEIFVEKAIQSGFAISSGGALGIDSIAENSARKSGGISIITVPDKLAKRITDPVIRSSILNDKTIYLSLVNPYSKFYGYNAMARNKLIYALSDYAMVVTCSFISDESGRPYPNKGGTFVGAHECVKFNLSKLLVRDSGMNTPAGNRYLINELPCTALSEDKVYSNLNFDELLLQNSLTTHSY